MAFGSPLLVSDLDDEDAARRWPGFTPQARQIGAAAIFALPLRIGAIRVGSLGLYRDEPGPLSTAQLGDALIFADTATMVLLESQHALAEAPARSNLVEGNRHRGDRLLSAAFACHPAA